MRLTNDLGLPEVIGLFELANKHSRGSYDDRPAKYSCTELIDSPRISALRREHDDEYVVDLSDRLQAMWGTAMHLVLQGGVEYAIENPGALAGLREELGGGADSTYIAEHRYYAEVDGVLVSGQADLVTITPFTDGELVSEARKLSDWKTLLSIALRRNPEGKPEWTEQLNVLAALARINGEIITELEAVRVIRDWSAYMREDKNKPIESSIAKYPIELWDEDKALHYLRLRIQQHECYGTVIHDPDTCGEACHCPVYTPPCTDTEMWASEAEYAVHTLKKAIGKKKPEPKVHPTLKTPSKFEAIEFMQDNPGSIMKEKPKRYARCDGNWCRIREFCTTYQERNSE